MAKEIISKKVIAKLGTRELRITTIDGEDKFDIRKWQKDTPLDGVRFTDTEMEQLSAIIMSIVDANMEDMELGTIGNKKCVINSGSYYLTIDHNGRTYKMPFASTDEMAKLKEILEQATKQTDKNLHDFLAEYGEEKPKAKSNIVMFKSPKAKEEITDKLVTEGNATYEQCEEKIGKEMEIFTDEDSQYVLVGLLELCKVDADFRNNLMREDKSFDGAMSYMMTMCQKGYGFTKGNMGFMSRDMGLGFAIDYYNVKPEPPKKSKTEPKATTEKKKRGRPKKGA